MASSSVDCAHSGVDSDTSTEARADDKDSSKPKFCNQNHKRCKSLMLQLEKDLLSIESSINRTADKIEGAMKEVQKNGQNCQKSLDEIKEKLPENSTAATILSSLPSDDDYCFKKFMEETDVPDKDNEMLSD